MGDGLAPSGDLETHLTLEFGGYAFAALTFSTSSSGRTWPPKKATDLSQLEVSFEDVAGAPGDGHLLLVAELAMLGHHRCH